MISEERKNEIIYILVFILFGSVISYFVFHKYGESVSNILFLIVPLIMMYVKKFFLKPKGFLVDKKKLMIFDSFFSGIIGSYIFVYLIIKFI